MSEVVSVDELVSFVERLERLEGEKETIQDMQKDVLNEAKAKGFEPKILRKIIAIRKRDSDDVATEEELIETYKSALGM